MRKSTCNIGNENIVQMLKDHKTCEQFAKYWRTYNYKFTGS